MEKSIKAAEEYEDRALASIHEAKEHLKNKYFETAVSKAYYACFYAVHSQLSRLGIEASSHKQAGIQFRRHFVKTRRLSSKFSETWQKLFEWRMEADYDSTPDIDIKQVEELIRLGEEFVTEVLKIKI